MPLLQLQKRSRKFEPLFAVPAKAEPAAAPSPERARIPRCLAEIDNGKILGFGADLAKDHPVRFVSSSFRLPILFLGYVWHASVKGNRK